MTEPTCDVCGATDPPRTPLWRSNTEKVCDPCWDRIQTAIADRTPGTDHPSPSSPGTEPRDTASEEER